MWVFGVSGVEAVAVGHKQIGRFFFITVTRMIAHDGFEDYLFFNMRSRLLRGIDPCGGFFW